MPKPRKRRPRRPGPPLPPPALSATRYVRIAPSDVAMFRFLLEASDNVGYFTVIDKREALLKVIYSPHQEKELLHVLRSMQETVAFTLVTPPWQPPVAPEHAGNAVPDQQATPNADEAAHATAETDTLPPVPAPRDTPSV